MILLLLRSLEIKQPFLIVKMSAFVFISIDKRVSGGFFVLKNFLMLTPG